MTVGRICDAHTAPLQKKLLDDFERGALAVTRRGTVQHGADRVNGLAVATDDAADVALAELHFKNRHLAARDFRQHHVVRKFHELPNDELEEFLHVDSGEGGGSAGGGGGSGIAGAGGAADSVTAGTGVAAGSAAVGAFSAFGVDAAFFAAAAAAFLAAASGFLVFLIKLRTVSEGCAPLLIQCSIRSNFKVLFCPAFFGS